MLIAAAAATGASDIWVGVGGSASTDGGRGALQAIADAGGLGSARLTVLCDVTARYLEAARVFGLQKGADRDTVLRLEKALNDFAEGLPRDPRGIPRTGAAGGLSGALWAVHGAQLVSGIDHVLDIVGFDKLLNQPAGAQLSTRRKGVRFQPSWIQIRRAAALTASRQIKTCPGFCTSSRSCTCM